MFEKLIELLAAGWDFVKPFTVVDAYEHHVVLRFGKFSRTLPPGLHPKWPFAERAVEVLTAVSTLRLPPQTLTTKDGKGVVVGAIVKYQIRDPEPYVTSIWDQADVLADVTMGAIAETVESTDSTDLLPSAKITRSMLEQVRKEVNRFGFKIEKITLTDAGFVKTIRLMQPDHVKDLAN